jgi:hypothetical protein
MVSRKLKHMKKNDHAALMISIMYMLYRKTFVVVVVPYIPSFHHDISFLYVLKLITYQHVSHFSIGIIYYVIIVFLNKQ